MQVVVAPEILQILAVAAADDNPLSGAAPDAYLRPGRYLRWMPNPLLGFPRRGFVLHRRPSPQWPWTKRGDMAEAKVADGTQDGAALWLAAEGASDEIRGRRGARVSRPGSTAVASPQGVALDGTGTMVEFVDQVPMRRPDPASWVALRLAGPSSTTVSATAWASSGTDDDSVLSEVAEQLGSLPAWDQARDPDGDRVLLLHGGLVDAVELHATGSARLVEAKWLVTELYAIDNAHTQQAGWQEVGRFLLPLDGDGTRYPSQPDADNLAAERLARGAPRAQPPWADQSWPPAEVSESTAADMWKQRHLGAPLTQLQQLLARVLDEELDLVTPQGSVRVKETLQDPSSTDGQADEVDLDVPAVPLLLTASLDAPLAHLLGLATVDREPPTHVPYDYVISAVYPSMWMAALMNPGLVEMLAEHADIFAAIPDRVMRGLVPPLPPDRLDPEGPFFRAVSVATMVLPGPVAPVPQPTDVRVDMVPVPGREPVAAEALLAWRVPMSDTFDPVVVVGATAARRDDAGSVSLARMDPVLGHRQPYLASGSEQHLRDADLRVSGQATWAVQSFDIWGRWSAPSTTSADIPDGSPPPPPSGITAALQGAIDDDAGTVERIVIGFDWSAGQASMAPAIARFEVAVTAGAVDAEDAVTQASTVVSVTPDGAAASPRGTASADRLDDGGLRIHVAIPDPAADRDGYRRVATAAVRAVDDGDRMSRPASALAEIVEEAAPTVPDGLPGVQRTSWPDADGIGWWTCRWQPQQGVRVQVMRAAGSRLLDAAGQTRDALAGMRVEQQAAHLRDLAVNHPNAFAPDHPRSYPHPTETHAVAVDGASHDLTVVVTVPTGPTGTRATWPSVPDAFTVVAARRLDPLARPLLRVRAQDDGVRVEVAASGGARARVWCTNAPDSTRDIRTMRPLKPAPLADGTAVLSDDLVDAGTWYAYRAVVEAADGRRSVATDPVWVRTVDAP